MDSRRHFLGKVVPGLAGTLVAVPSRVFAASDRVRVGIIGVGDRGLELLNQIRACGSTEVVALADIYNKRLEKAASFVPAAELYDDYRRLLEDRSLDAVVIATPPHVHARPFADALAAGKHVYVEKALANTLEQAKSMRTAYQQDGGRHVVQVGHQACSFGHAGDVSQFMANPQRLGQLSALVMRNFRNLPYGKAPWARPALLTGDVNPRNIAWEQFDKGAFDAQRFIHWRYFWDYSGGAVSENMSQQLAFWYRALGLAIPYSAAMTGGVYLSPDGRETPDTMSVTLEQPEQIHVSWSCGFGNNQLGVTEDLLGTHGTIARGNQVRYVPQKMNRADDTELLGRSTHVPHAHMQNFFDSIRTNREPNAPFELGYRVTVACLLAVESYRLRRTVYWDAESEAIV